MLTMACDAECIALHHAAKVPTMAKAITLRLDEADHNVLVQQADQLRVSPGTLARMLVHAGLSDGTSSGGAAQSAITRLVQRSQSRPAADAVALVDQAREESSSRT